MVFEVDSFEVNFGRDKTQIITKKPVKFYDM